MALRALIRIAPLSDGRTDAEKLELLQKVLALCSRNAERNLVLQRLDLRDYEHAEYLVLATRRGLVKKTRLAEYDSNRTGGVIAINLRENDEGLADELVSARLVDPTDEPAAAMSATGPDGTAR